MHEGKNAWLYPAATCSLDLTWLRSHSLSHSLTHSYAAHALSHSLTHSLARSLTHLRLPSAHFTKRARLPLMSNRIPHLTHQLNWLMPFVELPVSSSLLMSYLLATTHVFYSHLFDQGEGELGSVQVRDRVPLASSLDVVLNATPDGRSEVTVSWSRRRSFR